MLVAARHGPIFTECFVFSLVSCLRKIYEHYQTSQNKSQNISNTLTYPKISSLLNSLLLLGSEFLQLTQEHKTNRKTYTKIYKNLQTGIHPTSLFIA